MKNLTLVLLAIICGSIYSCKKSNTGITAKATADFRNKYTGVYTISQSGSTTYYPEGASSYTTKAGHYGFVTVSHITTDSITAYWDPSNPRKIPAVLFTYDSGVKAYYGIDSFGHFFRNTSPSGSDSGGFIGTDSIYQVYYNYTGHSSTVDTMWGHK